jgi:LmbE family N-acetylglucosaminyl deacetylase
MNILAIGAHPDDIEIGCGGLLLKAVKAGHNVYMYTLTRGSVTADPERRVREQLESARIIGATVWIDGLEDSKLSLNAELINRIETAMRTFNADIVYTHALGDTHHDHRAIAQATLEAGRYVPNILSYEIPVTKEFNPTLYCDISETIEDKVALLNIFSSQSNNICLRANGVKGLAQYRALQNRLLDQSITSVESFEVQKLGIGINFDVIKTRYEPIYARQSKCSQLVPEGIIENTPSLVSVMEDNPSLVSVMEDNPSLVSVKSLKV